WAASGYAEGVPVALNGHLICGDALAGNFPVPTPRKAGHSRREFDAVVGNPPYVASKNRLLDPRRGRGQSDSYLMFLTTVLERGLVRPGGVLSMVLPDPMLVRQNAASIRCKLAGEWTIESILHIFGAFPDAVVANIVPVVRNLRPASETFYVSRIERAADRRNFAINPCATALELARPVRRQVVLAQKRCEFLYLLEEGPFAGIIRRIHGPGLSLAEYQPPFVPLCRLNVRAIYRGEEVGKSAITRRKGELRMLLGGESVQPYEIIWGGHRVAAERVVKPLSRYGATKVLIQKSAGRVVAALDEVRKGHRGYVFPQSVYAVELTPEGVDHLYLLCILNSQVINEYVRRTVTAYKMVQPQLELEDIRSLPIRRISFTTAPSTRAREVVRALSIFDDECLRAAENMHFPELANFVGRYLSANPEMSDVVHDILVRLGRLAVDLTRTSRKSPEPGVTHRLECVRAAIEAVVWKLYSTDPAQMALAL
ncbi:MAG: TaqI-like C-terminal specificity domain-containing protein, partial [Armatimonadota bacterium]